MFSPAWDRLWPAPLFGGNRRWLEGNRQPFTCVSLTRCLFWGVTDGGNAVDGCATQGRGVASMWYRHWHRHWWQQAIF